MKSVDALDKIQNFVDTELTQSGIKIKDLHDCTKSQNLCSAASIILCDAFKGCSLFIGRGYCGLTPLNWHDKPLKNIVHTMILYNDNVIDFTSRQFFFHEPWPRILPLEKAKAEWTKTEIISIKL